MISGKDTILIIIALFLIIPFLVYLYTKMGTYGFYRGKWLAKKQVEKEHEGSK